MDAPSASNPTQLGTVNIKGFSVHDETAARTGRVQSGPQPPRGSQ